jgi:hypothetical protein
MCLCGRTMPGELLRNYLARHLVSLRETAQSFSLYYCIRTLETTTWHELFVVRINKREKGNGELAMGISCWPVLVFRSRTRRRAHHFTDCSQNYCPDFCFLLVPDN